MTVRIDEAKRARFGARDIAGLIRIYEANYVRLTKLIHELPACEPMMVSRVAGTLDLHLEIIERQPYTTSLKLTYRFPDGDGWVLEPNARINVYHDVRAAEARRALPSTQEPQDSSLDTRSTARTRPQVANESFPPEVAQILYVPGAYLHSRNHSIP